MPAPSRRSTAPISPLGSTGPQPKTISFDAAAFDEFRHGYAGTIYRGQGKTLDQTYLYHSEHWRSAASYVALTRHRDKTELFVARNTAKDLDTLARQMARTDERRAASMFHPEKPLDPVPVLTPLELAARLAPDDARRERERLYGTGEEYHRSAQRHDPAPFKPETDPYTPEKSELYPRIGGDEFYERYPGLTPDLDDDRERRRSR